MFTQTASVHMSLNGSDGVSLSLNEWMSVELKHLVDEWICRCWTENESSPHFSLSPLFLCLLSTVRCPITAENDHKNKIKVLSQVRSVDRQTELGSLSEV